MMASKVWKKMIKKNTLLVFFLVRIRFRIQVFMGMQVSGQFGKHGWHHIPRKPVTLVSVGGLVMTNPTSFMGIEGYPQMPPLPKIRKLFRVNNP